MKRFIGLGVIVTVLGCKPTPASPAADSTVALRQAPAGANSGSAADSLPPADPRSLVAAFYAWYVPNADSIQDIDKARRQRRSWLGHDLAAALDSDRACLAQSEGEICGLDSDPFINGQDFCGPFRVGDAKTVGDGVEVPLFSPCPSEARNTTPWVIAVVRMDAGRNRIVNLRYPASRTDVFGDIKRAHQR